MGFFDQDETSVKVSDFKIGDTFTMLGTHNKCPCRVTDVGSRTLVYIVLDKGDDTSWYSGPPYAVVEHVVDEDDLCIVTKITKDTENDPK